MVEGTVVKENNICFFVLSKIIVSCRTFVQSGLDKALQTRSKLEKKHAILVESRGGERERVLCGEAPTVKRLHFCGGNEKPTSIKLEKAPPDCSCTGRVLRAVKS